MVIRQNRAVPILLVLTFAFILYLGGCFGTNDTTTAETETSTPIPTLTAPPIVDPGITPPATAEEPFYYTIQSGDQLAAVASSFNVTLDQIIRANPQLDPSLYFAGDRLLIPGATTNNETVENLGPERPDGVSVTYVVQPGDTLGVIAQTWTVSLEAIYEANPDVDAASLQPNQLLEIPPWGSGIDASELSPRVTPVASTRSPNDPPLEHQVVAGDFISAIAELYNVTNSQIVDANGLDNNGNDIQVGDTLLIPPPLAPNDDG